MFEDDKDCLERTQLYARLLGAHLCRVLRLVDLESSGEFVSADLFGYRASTSISAKADNINNSRSTLPYNTLRSYARNEPRVELIQRALARALRFGEFHCDGRRLSVSGFRWRDLKQWASYGPMSVFNAIGVLSSRCNCDCDFCPRTRVAPAVDRSQLSLSEVATRLKYYKSDVGKGLPPTTRLPLEPFANQSCVDILKLMRDAAPEQLIEEETNGSFLTEDVVAELAKLKPIFLFVSLNGVDIDARRDRMRETDEVSAQTAMRSPSLLREYKIPFGISYVSWPNRSLREIEELVSFAETADALAARICLPMTLSGWEDYWKEIVQFVDSLRPRFNIPIWTSPSIYEWQRIRPEVRSVIKNSPAAAAGIQYKDLIIGIDGEMVITQPQAYQTLSARAQDNTHKSTVVLVERDGEQLEFEIEPWKRRSDESYPYSELPAGFLPFGIDIPNSLGLRDIIALQKICEEHRGKRILFLIYSLAVPQFQEALSLLQGYLEFLDKVDLYLTPVQPAFYAGNGWLPARFWTISDIEKAVRDWMHETNLHADVILIPYGALSPAGRDMLGESFLDLELHLDVEVCEIPMSGIVA